MNVDRGKHTEQHAIDPSRTWELAFFLFFSFADVRTFVGLELVVHHEVPGFM